MVLVDMRPNAVEIGVGSTLVARVIGHATSVGAGLYMGYRAANGITETPETAMYAIPMAVSVASQAVGNTIERAGKRRYARPIVDGTMGAVQGGVVSALEITVGYGVGFVFGRIT